MTRTSGSHRNEKVTSDDRVVQNKKMFLANLSLFLHDINIFRVWPRAHLKDLGLGRTERASKATGLAGRDEDRTFWISLNQETAWEKYRTARTVRDPEQRKAYDSTRKRRRCKSRKARTGGKTDTPSRKMRVLPSLLVLSPVLGQESGNKKDK